MYLLQPLKPMIVQHLNEKTYVRSKQASSHAPHPPHLVCLLQCTSHPISTLRWYVDKWTA